MTALDDAVATGDRVTALAVSPEAIGIAGEVLQELKRPWGLERIPDGTGHDRAVVYISALQRMNDNRSGTGLTWAGVLLEEVAAAMNEKTGSPDLRTQLIELSAVTQRWVADIDRRVRERPINPLGRGPGRGLPA
jgi:hypothetical protein